LLDVGFKRFGELKFWDRFWAGATLGHRPHGMSPAGTAVGHVMRPQRKAY